MSNKNLTKGKPAAALLSILLILLGWHFVTSKSPLIHPPTPNVVLTKLQEEFEKGAVVKNILASLRRVSVGLSLGIFVGVALAILVSRTSFIGVVFATPLELIRPIPPLAWVSLTLLFLQLDTSYPAYFIVFLGAIFPIYSSSLTGLTQTPKGLLEMAEVFRVPRYKVFSQIILPFAWPQIMMGIRIGIGMSWMCVVSAEMLSATDGLGKAVYQASNSDSFPLIVGNMLVIGIVGALLTNAVRYVSAERLLRFRTNLRKDIDPANRGFRLSDLNLKGATVSLGAVSCQYNKTRIFESISFDLAAGNSIAIVGKSAVGKTSLLRIIAGISEPAGGTVQITAETGSLLRLAMVFQEDRLLPWKTALENVSFIAQNALQQPNASSRLTSTKDLLSGVGLLPRSQNFPHELSGGERQRVSLARALACEPNLLLLDEPFASLDQFTKRSLQEDLALLVSGSGVTTIFVTHDLDEAVYLADKILVLISPTQQFLLSIPTPRPRSRSWRTSAESIRFQQQILDMIEQGAIFNV